MKYVWVWLAGFYQSLEPPRTGVDIDYVARCCLTETQPDMMINASLAVFDCSCREEKLTVAAALDLSGEIISVCTEEFPPLVRSDTNCVFQIFNKNYISVKVSSKTVWCLGFVAVKLIDILLIKLKKNIYIHVFPGRITFI